MTTLSAIAIAEQFPASFPMLLGYSKPLTPISIGIETAIYDDQAATIQEVSENQVNETKRKRWASNDFAAIPQNSIRNASMTDQTAFLPSEEPNGPVLATCDSIHRETGQILDPRKYAGTISLNFTEDSK